MSAMTSTTSMTAIDYAALAERLEAHAECHANVEPFDDEQRQWADDLRTVVTMLRGMADAAPIYAYEWDTMYHTIKWVHRSFSPSSRNGRKPDRTLMLFTHPAPQPQPKCWCRSCLTPAELLSTFVVCPKCGNKRCPKADDHRNACTDSNAPGQAPQPERQSASEPTEAQIEAAADELYARRGMVSNECYAIVAERMLRAALAAKEIK